MRFLEGEVKQLKCSFHAAEKERKSGLKKFNSLKFVVQNQHTSEDEGSETSEDEKLAPPEAQIGVTATKSKKTTLRCCATVVRSILILSAGHSHVQSHQKCQMRVRKRGNLPADSEWRNKKYDTIFTGPLMSDDEYQLTANSVKTGAYLTLLPAYRSDIVSIPHCI